MVMHSHYVGLAEEAGCNFGDTVHIMRNGEEMVLPFLKSPVRNSLAPQTFFK